MSTESDGYVSFGVGLLFGMGVGAVLGLLLAPKSGTMLRSELCTMAHSVPDNVNQTLDDTKDKCSNMIDRTRYSIEKQVNKFNNALKAGKMASAKKREELDEDLGY